MIDLQLGKKTSTLEAYKWLIERKRELLTLLDKDTKALLHVEEQLLDIVNRLKDQVSQRLTN